MYHVKLLELSSVARSLSSHMTFELVQGWLGTGKYVTLMFGVLLTPNTV